MYYIMNVGLCCINEHISFISVKVDRMRCLRTCMNDDVNDNLCNRLLAML